MISIVMQTRYGDTIFVSNPVKAARAMVIWAAAQGHSQCEMEDLDHGCIRVNIPRPNPYNLGARRDYRGLGG